MKTFLIRGVPVAMQQDGWWFSGDAGPKRTQVRPERGGAPEQLWRAGLLVPLIALGDVLVWQVAPGLSLAVFGAALMMAALWVAGVRTSEQRQALVAGGSLLVLLPLVELVQPLSLMIAVVGVSAMLALLAGLRPAEVWRGALRLWPMGVVQTVQDGAHLSRTQTTAGLPALARQLVLTWLLPLTMGLVFALLLMQANPIAETWADGLLRMDIRTPGPARMMFWTALVPILWTALSLHRMHERLRAAPGPRYMGPQRLGLINPASVARALILFNAVFAVQAGLDAVYLYGGARLPEGITYAQYAHRGAYPLLVTALLAGGFALLTRRWTDGSGMLRGLMMLWVAQNVALVISSLVRLDLYVAVYGLTHLRIAAAIWMALVAAGLALILWQVWRGHRNGWLVLRGGALSAVVLYACAWVSFDAVIARYNLNHPVRQDVAHLCRLGDAAQPVIVAREQGRGWPICRDRHVVRTPHDWREWGFRNWRARNSLAALETEAAL